jgi:hypothetical protein
LTQLSERTDRSARRIVFDHVSFTYKQNTYNYFDKHYEEQEGNEFVKTEQNKQSKFASF